MSTTTTVSPLYDIDKTYLENAEEGPFFTTDIPKREAPKELYDFLGFKVASPIGVPAGPLLNSKWIGLAGQLGFDILCYKTVRNAEHPGHGLPNMVHLDAPEQLNQTTPTLQISDSPPNDLSQITVTNSFGMPSRSRAYLQEDIPRANAILAPDQVMIVSIVGSPTNFVETALFAKECGAKIIEANFSCPNVATKEGTIGCDPEQVQSFSSALVKALGPTPLIIKVGTYASPELMREVFIAAAKAGVRAISGINTIKARIVDSSGGTPLGPDRPHSGVCGNAIRDAALNFITNAAAINQQEKLDLTLIGVGGITEPEHFQLFLDSGADVAMSATGMMWNPYLAHHYHQENEWKKRS